MCEQDGKRESGYEMRVDIASEIQPEIVATVLYTFVGGNNVNRRTCS